MESRCREVSRCLPYEANAEVSSSPDTSLTMLRVFDVTFTPTADFILSASDDGNVRIWKSNASKKIGPVSTKERQSIEYRQKLVEKWSSTKEVRAVKDRRHVPGSIHSAVKLKRDMIEAGKVREERRRKHTRAGQEKPKAERKSMFSPVLVMAMTDNTTEAVITEQK
jgi:WD repeat and SOF domain-containing protein 1